MKYYLYKFSDNWADEMDVKGFAVLTETQKDIAVSKIKRNFKKGGTICFGSNEDNEYDSLQDVMDCIEIKQISQSEYNTIIKLFGSTSMGELGPIDNDNIEDVDEEEIECCEECGEELDEDGVCGQCEETDEDKYENEYNKQAGDICNFIKKEYSLEETHSSTHYSKFIWKPTPKSQIEILIGEYEGGDEEIEFTLKINNKQIRYEFFLVEEVYEDTSKLKSLIKELIEKSKKF